MVLKETNVSNAEKLKNAEPEAMFILVTRFYIRWKKEKFKSVFNDWLRELSPSPELHRKWFPKDGTPRIPWEEYLKVFEKEMDNPESKAAMKKIALKSKKQTVYLVCYEKEYPCHRFLLMDMIDGKKHRISSKCFSK